ncbi:Chemotaxis protein CheA [anaerobic digester metagenome]
MSEFEAYRGLFVAESRENHETIVKSLLVLEQGVDETAIDEIFRAVHTLKGASASMGFDEPERLCHSMEDVLSLIRAHTLDVSQPVVDLLLTCTDVIEEMVDGIETGGPGHHGDTGQLVDLLRKWVDLGADTRSLSVATGPDLSSPMPGPDPGPSSIDPVDFGDRPVYSVHVRVSEESAMADVRAMLVLTNLDALGTVLSTTPSRQAIDEGSFQRDLMVEIASDAGQEALQIAASGTEIAEVTVSSFDSKIEETPDVIAPVCPSGVRDEDDRRTREREREKGREIKNIRVDIHQLDHIMNLVEDLVINRGRLKQIAELHRIKEMDEAISVVERSVSELQNLMMLIRMIPLNQIFNRFPRVVRDVAKHDEKEVEFLIEGGETELDRSVMDGLSDPLLHLIRNGINHGIELPDTRERAGKRRVGKLRLSAHRDRDNVVIELADDGAGIDVERVRKKAVERGLTTSEAAALLSDDEVVAFLFQPGFSTAEKITDISGRGVGLDVVKSSIEALKGSVKVSSVPGEGTRFELMLPPTMAIIQVMIVRINSRRIAIPINSVIEVASLAVDSIHRIGSNEAILLRDEVLPIYRLDDMFGAPVSGGIILVVQYQDQKCGVPLDLVEGQQEVVVKPLNRLIGSSRGVSGVTILGDGDVVPVVDVNTMV